MLEGRNLRELGFISKTRDERARCKALETDAQAMKKGIDRHSRLFNGERSVWTLEDVKDTAKMLNEHHAPAILHPPMDPEDGFQVVGAKAAHLDPLQSWLRANDLNVGVNHDLPKPRPEEPKKPKLHSSNGRKVDENPFDFLEIEDSDEDSSETASENLLESFVPELAEYEQIDAGVSFDISSLDRTCDELLVIDDPWTMSTSERERLFEYWKELCELQLAEGVKYLADYNIKVQERKDIETACQLRVLRDSCVIGMTTTGAASYQRLLQALQPSIVICEEAGEVLEAHLVAALSSGCQQLILIGDHQQLRPYTEEYTFSMESNSGYKMDMSIFERIVTECTDETRKNIVTLHQQRRMRPEIADYTRLTYPQLTDAPEVMMVPDNSTRKCVVLRS